MAVHILLLYFSAYDILILMRPDIIHDTLSTDNMLSLPI